MTSDRQNFRAEPKSLVSPNGTHTHPLEIDGEGSNMALHKHDFDSIDHHHSFDGEDTGPGAWLMEWPMKEDDDDDDDDKD